MAAASRSKRRLSGSSTGGDEAEPEPTAVKSTDEGTTKQAAAKSARMPVFTRDWSGLKARMTLCRVWMAASLDRAPADSKHNRFRRFQARIHMTGTMEVISSGLVSPWDTMASPCEQAKGPTTSKLFIKARNDAQIAATICKGIIMKEDEAHAQAVAHKRAIPAMKKSGSSWHSGAKTKPKVPAASDDGSPRRSKRVDRGSDAEQDGGSASGDEADSGSSTDGSDHDPGHSDAGGPGAPSGLTADAAAHTVADAPPSSSSSSSSSHSSPAAAASTSSDTGFRRDCISNWMPSGREAPQWTLQQKMGAIRRLRMDKLTDGERLTPDVQTRCDSYADLHERALLAEQQKPEFVHLWIDHHVLSRFCKSRGGAGAAVPAGAEAPSKTRPPRKTAQQAAAASAAADTAAKQDKVFDLLMRLAEQELAEPAQAAAPPAQPAAATEAEAELLSRLLAAIVDRSWPQVHLNGTALLLRFGSQQLRAICALETAMKAHPDLMAVWHYASVFLPSLASPEAGFRLEDTTTAAQVRDMVLTDFE